MNVQLFFPEFTRAVLVEIAAVGIHQHNHRKILHPEKMDGFGAQVFIGQNTAFLDASCNQCRGYYAL